MLETSLQQRAVANKTTALRSSYEKNALLVTSEETSIHHATAAHTPPSGPIQYLTIVYLIVISSVEKHEALRSGQLPSDVWAHEGSRHEASQQQGRLIQYSQQNSHNILEKG
ncbi:hypothetical protein M3J09_004497 [Ascochyta lentis]